MASKVFGWCWTPIYLKVKTSAEHIVWRYIVIPNIVSFSKYRINIVIAFFLDNITRYCMHVILVYFSLSWTCESKMTFKISYGLTYNSMNWSNLCICYTFEEWNFVYCTVFSRISRKCRNFCDLRAYFTKWEISCNIVWLSYQNPKYRVISCVSKKSISLRGVPRRYMLNKVLVDIFIFLHLMAE